MAAFGARQHDNALTSPADSAAAVQMGHVVGVGRQVSCATTHGLEGMVKGMTIEWGQLGIRINTLCPTFAHTPLIEETLPNPDRLAWIEEKVTPGRDGEVEAIMGAVRYLASDAPALVTGSSLRVDGGWTAG